MEKHKKQCLIEFLRPKYQVCGKKKRGEILDELVESLGVCRRQARRLMEPKPVGRPRKLDGRGRPSKYGVPGFEAALRFIWKKTRYMCSRHLHAAIPEWLPFIEAAYGPYPANIRTLLLQVSASTIDRKLKPFKAVKGKSTTNPGGFRDEIPIQGNIWNEHRPGFLEADTVAHCGGSLMGEYINSLTMVDIATVWTETRCVCGKASGPIVSAIEDIEQCLPFDILGYDSDNGTEVLNTHILRYFRDERIERGKKPVQVTRSRPYKSNDNAYVEQRNDSVPRRWLGYERLGFVELTPLVNYYFRDIVCPLINHFFPTFKLADKRRINSKTRRVYGTPITPYARVMASPYVSDERKKALKEIHVKLNPIVLSDLQYNLSKQIDGALKNLRQGMPANLEYKPNPLFVFPKPDNLPLRKN